MAAAASACATVASLAIAKHQLGHWPTQAEYAAYWKLSERRAQREWHASREAFPGERTPESLARHVLAEASHRLDNQAAALSVPAPDGLVPA